MKTKVVDQPMNTIAPAEFDLASSGFFRLICPQTDKEPNYFLESSWSQSYEHWIYNYGTGVVLG
jgi:hypothetical protein